MIFIDDLGWCTSQVFLRLDFMFRTMTDSDKLFGGALVIVNMDPLQLSSFHSFLQCYLYLHGIHISCEYLNRFLT
jgi:hypothetical protein